MKHTKTVEVPARTKEIIEYVTCDLCGQKIERDDIYDVNEVKITHKTGSNYPDGGSGEEASVDMCGKCFDEKLVPWLKNQGVELHKEDWDW